MSRKLRNLLLLTIATIGITVAGWAVVRFKERNRNQKIGLATPAPVLSFNAEQWARAIEKVKEDRAEMGGGAIETPPQLRHYSDRHWFLASQVAEVKRFNLQSCQDFVDLAAMIQHGELVVLPAVTDTYVLFGVGARADESVFDRYQDDQNVELYNEAELRDAYSRLDAAHSDLASNISRLKSQLAAVKKNDRTTQGELRKQITAREQELQKNEEDRALLDQVYGQQDRKQRLFMDYASLQALAQNFAGRSFNLHDPADRQAMRVMMLSSLRPEAVKILEEVAAAYHDKFDRPLPVSSLVRPEQYQHELRRVNRNAVLIEVPPHTTGLAFDIDYRYMTATEQNFLMTELARLKDEGRIEVIRERSANYHVFTFVEGKRPSDELIAASLEEASIPVTETHHAVEKSAKVKSQPRTVKKKTKMAAKVSRSKSRKRR